MNPRLITSRDNAVLQQIRRLQRDPMAYRRVGAFWLEGEHLCQAYLGRGGRGARLVVSASVAGGSLADHLAAGAADLVQVTDSLFAELSSLPSSAGIGMLCPLPPAVAVQPGVATVVLDRLQDAGNVGSILRTASALGFGQVVALRGTAGLWSPKVLRAGMGAQFGLRLLEAQEADVLDTLGVPLLATSSHGGQLLTQARLPDPCAWLFGHEGQGVDGALASRCSLQLGIPQPGGEESLNVAAAAAICLYESMRQRPPA